MRPIAVWFCILGARRFSAARLACLADVCLVDFLCIAELAWALVRGASVLWGRSVGGGKSGCGLCACARCHVRVGCAFGRCPPSPRGGIVAHCVCGRRLLCRGGVCVCGSGSLRAHRDCECCSQLGCSCLAGLAALIDLSLLAWRSVSVIACVCMRMRRGGLRRLLLVWCECGAFGGFGWRR